MQRPPKARPLQSKPLIPISPVTRAQVVNVLENVEKKWAENAYGLQQRLSEAIAANDPRAAQGWTWCNGVTTDKLLTFAGRPIAIVANLHAHRHELSDIASKLLIASQVQARHAQRGYAHIVDANVGNDPSPSRTLPVKRVGSPVDASGHMQVADIVDNG